MHRPTLGLIAIVLLAVGYFTREQADTTLSSACLRVGVIVCILWFAQPQMRNMPRWLVIAAGLVGFLVLRWPKLLLFALPVGLVLWILRPRSPGRGSSVDRRA